MRRIKFLSVLVLLAAVLLSAYPGPAVMGQEPLSQSDVRAVATPSSVPPRDWLVFNHPTLGYSVGYPKDFHLFYALDEAGTVGDIVTLASYVPGVDDPGYCSVPAGEIQMDIGVFAKKKPASQDLKDWYAEYLHELVQITSTDVVEPTSQQSTRITNQGALHIRSDVGLNNHELVLIPRGERVYFIQKWPAVSPYDNIFSQLLASFRFTEAVSDSPTIANPSRRPPGLAKGVHAPAGYRLPFSGTYAITSGPRCHCQHYSDPQNCAQYWRSEEAIDFGLPLSTSVYNSHGGTVVYRDYNTQGFGLLAVIKDSGGLKAYYAHLYFFSWSLPSVGKWVNQSVIIGYSGQSGGVAPHLHFEVRDSNDNDSPVEIRDMAGITWNPDNCTGSATY